MSNRLIVESKNDQIFIQTLVNYLNLLNIRTSSLESISLSKDDYRTLSGLSFLALEKELETIKADAQKEIINKVGIIVDADQSISERLDLINSALKKVFPQIKEKLLTITNEFQEVNSDAIGTIQIACHIINVDNLGELENLLKAIKTEESIYADCLESWRSCLQEKHKNVSDKEFVKFWVNTYIRFDTCSPKDKKQAEKKCSMSMNGFEYVMANKKHIWNFEHSALNELKKFLRMF